jgi:hypothetical protein
VKSKQKGVLYVVRVREGIRIHSHLKHTIMAIISVKQGKAVKTFKPRNYVDFWSDHVSHHEDSGLGNIMLKAIKLKNYQNAIANFVKILTNKDIPVVYKGTDSYTNGEKVVLAGDLNDKKFDVSAGLALHEASHIKHTSWETLKKIDNITDDYFSQQNVKGLLNWIEDRRIDNLVFKSSPGYKGYYHSMYDHYFRSKEVTMMLGSADYREPTYKNYMAHLINMMNPAFDSNALPGLRAIVALIDVNNIDRLKDTDDALELAIKVHEFIQLQVEKAKEEEQETNNVPNNVPKKSEEKEEEEQEEQKQGAGGSSEREEEKEGGGEGKQEVPKLTPSEKAKVQKKMQEIENMIKGDVDKKALKNKQATMVKEVTESGIEISSTVGGKFDCAVYRLDKKTSTVEGYYNALVRKDSNEYWEGKWDVRHEINAEIRKYAKLLPPTYMYHHNSVIDQTDKYIQPGVQLGAILGRKLLVRRESRSLEHNRLRNGRIDTKRIAHAGYGIESIFNQINVESKRDAVIHLTLDASGSMSGERWNNSIKLSAALIKAVSMVEGLELQISTRDSGNFGSSHLPVLTVLYDSKINKPQYGYRVLAVTRAGSLTPEGICLEALMDRKILKPSTQGTDSYLINICDGDPFFEGNGNKARYYARQEALNHTRKQVTRMNNELQVKHAGFFFGGEGEGAYTRFKQMYGAKQSVAMPDANNAMHIAQHINKQLMA